MVKAYHGTTNYFSSIDSDTFGQNRGAEFGTGFYLTTDAPYAENYIDFSQGIVLSGEINEEALLVRNDEPASEVAIKRVKSAFSKLFPSEKDATDFNRGSFLVTVSDEPISNLQMFNKLEKAISQLTSWGIDRRDIAVAQGVSDVLGEAGFTGVHDVRDSTIVIFKPENLPDLSLHKVSPTGRPEGMPEDINVGDVVVKPLESVGECQVSPKPSGVKKAHV